MKISYIILSIIVIVAIILLAIAPWMNNEKIKETITQEKGKINHTVDENGNLICEYKISWFPFGRSASSCEGGPYFIGFWNI